MAPIDLAPPLASDAPIWRIFLTAFHTPALVLADDLGVFAHLAEHPATAAELALACQIEVRAAETIAGVMAALEVLHRLDGRYHLSEVARTYLVPGQPYYWGGMLRRIREHPLDARRLAESLRQGRAAADARATAMWDAPVPPDPALVAFTHAMHAHSFALAMRVMPALDLDVERVLDVAGGSGSYSIAAVLHHPRTTATVLDLPAVCAVTRSYADQYRGGDRIATHPANMFTDAWPGEVDRVFLADIFHDWDDARCLALARRARAALRPGGRVVIHEMVLADTADGPLAGVAYSMAMLFSTIGRQRTTAELTALLRDGGLVDLAVRVTSSGYVAVSGAAP